jgi:GH24 family phage-related lysozyme (muramidase)
MQLGDTPLWFAFFVGAVLMPESSFLRLVNQAARFRFCRNFYEWLQKGLSLDTIMQQVRRIAEMRIDHWFQIDAF